MTLFIFRKLQQPLIMGTAALLLFFSHLTFARPLLQQAKPNSKIRLVAKDESGAPVADASVQLKRRGEIAVNTVTDEKGEAVATGFPPGSYEITVTKDGFEPRTQKDVVLAEDQAAEIEFTLVPKIAVTDKVEVSASANAAALPEQTASTGVELQRAQVKYLPNRPTSVTDTLPLLPGVTRSPQGEIKISGTGENRSAFVVNSADVTDPATGQFGMTVPVDSVQSINVFKTPYLAQYGRFTAGVVSVETRRGGEKWNFELNDPLPEFRYLNGGLRGLYTATPRVVFNGPLIKNKLYLSEGSEYAIRKTPVRTLAHPHRETKSESINSFTQLDYLHKDTHTVTATFHYAPRRDSFVYLDYFNQRPVTPNWKGRDYTGTVIDRLTFGANLLESTLALKRYTIDVWGQGRAEMNLTPTGNTGNYFSEQEREAQRAEWLETLSLAPINAFGAHNLKFGSIIARTTNRGQFNARPVNIQDVQGRLLRRVEFTGGAQFDLKDLETHFYGQDHWVITPKLSLDTGLRFERQGIAKTYRFAPRVGLAWTPFAAQKTVFRTGYGIFYDRVPLSVYAFNRFPEQVLTGYDLLGNVIDGPRRFANIIGSAAQSRSPFLGGPNVSGNFAPYSATWSFEAEHSFSPLLRLRVNYLHSDSNGVVTVKPRVIEGREALVLGGDGRSKYRQLELTARVTMQEGKHQFFLSYVNSKARGDYNEFNTYIGNFPFPLVRANQYAPLAADLPHRFMAWGTLNFPRKIRFSPIVEYRNGLPFSVTDERQNFVGQINSLRFPRFFSFDARLVKDFQVTQKYAARFSLSGFNLTNHFNALDVHRNIADPRYGIFFGNFQRQFRLDFDLIF